MKKNLLLIVLSVCSLFSVAQTATNFNVSDCNSNNHDLFTELNAGKVIVMTWVMPCGACINSAITSSNTVAGYASSNPGRVKYYLVDDAGNTSCTSLTGWASTNGFTTDAVFGNAGNIIKMVDYGTSGMPKTVVLGGAAHTVFYNINGTVVAGDMQTAIGNALAAPSGIGEKELGNFELSLFPSPVNSNATTLGFNLTQSGNVTIEVYNTLGAKVKDISLGKQSVGKHEEKIDFQSLSNGNYLVKLMVGQSSQMLKFTIAH